MACYIVIFELTDPARGPAFQQVLKKFGGYCPLTSHSWAITSALTAKEVRDQLSASLSSGDRLFVFRSGTEGAWLNPYSDKHTEWLKQNL